MENKISRLEEIANEQRKLLVMKNTFNSNSKRSEYSSTNTNALSDDETPENGMGTGKYMDFENGGNSYDKNARAESLRLNEYKDGKGYDTPDTSSIGNIIY